MFTKVIDKQMFWVYNSNIGTKQMFDRKGWFMMNNTHTVRRNISRSSMLKARRKRIIKKRIMGFVLALSVMLITSAVIMLKVDAKDTVRPLNVEKKYQTIVIESGDTLWSIAHTYAEDYVTIDEYIEELKIMNNLSGDRIDEGANLMITYYEEV